MINLTNMCPKKDLEKKKRKTIPNVPSIPATMKAQKYLGVRDVAER